MDKLLSIGNYAN